MNFLKANLLSFLALLLMIGFSIWQYPALPDQIPADFTIDGEVRGTRPKELVVILLPIIFILLIALINVLARISPQKFSMQNSRRALDIIVFGCGVMMGFLHFALLRGSFDDFVFYFSYGMAAFMVIVGNVFGKTERNFFIGIRLPWTINSISNWKATHRLAGHMMVACGAILLISNSFYSDIVITIVLCTATLLIPAIYSPIHYFKFEKDLEQ